MADRLKKSPTEEELLRRSTLFRELNPEQLREALRLLSAQARTHDKGDVIQEALQPMRTFGLVLQGAVNVSMTDINGREMLLSHVSAGQTFGESLCYLRSAAPIRITAAQDCRVLYLRCDGLRQAATPLQAELQRRFTAMLAQRTLRMNDRIQILSRGSIREKLDAFFTECARDAGSSSFTVPFDRAGMAAYLGVDRSALSRTLSRMQQEGVLVFHKDRFRLIK